jgi:threonine/homoserine/homoserine lactone efflux protein
MPGPLLSATISESGTREHGWMVGPLFMLGHALLELTLLAALFLGLAPLLTSRTAFVLIAFAGGGFMIWMAWGMFQIPAHSLSGDRASKGQRHFN